MDSKRTISISEARKRIFEIVEEVQTPDKVYTLTENGKPKAVVLSVQEYESLLETIQVLETFPDLDKDVAEAEKDYKLGKCITLDDMFAKAGYVLADKSKTKYGIPSRNVAKGAKRPQPNKRKSK